MNFPGPSSRASRAGTCLLLAFLAALLDGCGESPGSAQAAKIVIPAEAYFPGPPGGVVGPLVVQVLGQPLRGIPGRSGSRDPIAGTEVKFEVREEDITDKAKAPVILVDPESLPGGKPTEGTVKSDAQGSARVWVRLPTALGKWRVQAGVRGQFADEKKVPFQVASGLKVPSYGSGQENSIGRKVQVAVQVFRLGEAGKAEPAANSYVMFRVLDGDATGARLEGDRLADRVKATSEGVATIELFLGQKSGIYNVIAEPWTEGSETAQTPVAVLRGFAVDWNRVAVDLVCGALLFLIGLRLLGNGFLNLLGPALALPLKDFAGSRLRGYLGGVAAGALLQSASGVSSRLVSFAHGGLLATSAATAVLLGADLGRTVLPQALSFPITPAAGALLAVGALALFLPRRLGVHAWGWVFLGAGLVLSGFWLLTQGTDILQWSPSFREALREWNYREPDLRPAVRGWAFISALLLSTTAGFLLRSSSLPVALAIVLGEAGLLAPAAALPVVAGANLGPALSIAATTIWRRREARRLGLMGLGFQVIGLAWFSALCWIPVRGAPLTLHLIDWTTPGLLFHPQPEQVGHHLAMVHTLYNLLNGLLCLSLSRPLLRLVEKLIPRDPVRDDLKPYHLDPNLIEVPPLALLQATREVTYLTEMCRKAIAESFDAFRYRDLKLADQTVRREESIEGVHRDVCQYLLRVGENELSRRESSRLQVLQATTGNLVRIGELGERLRDLTTREIDEKLELPEDAARDLNDIYDLVMNQFDNVLQLLEHHDGRSEESAVKITERLAKFGSRMEQAWFEKLRAWEENGGGSATLLPAKIEGPHSLVKTGEPAEIAPPPPEATSPNGAPPHLSRALLFREALEALFLVAGHLSHIAETMRVLSPKR